MRGGVVTGMPSTIRTSSAGSRVWIATIRARLCRLRGTITSIRGDAFGRIARCAPAERLARTASGPSGEHGCGEGAGSGVNPR